MPTIHWKHLRGQSRVKQLFETALSRDTLAHAYLFSGPAGTGKFQAALELGMTLLCADADDAPCYRCRHCTRVLNYNHPDFGCVLPLELSSQHRDSSGALTTKGWDMVAETCRSHINAPYAPVSYKSVPRIPLEIIKENTHLIHRGPVEAPYTVVIFDRVEHLARESANALLKTLEEPPDNTVMICITDRISALLPTVVSRCQTVRFGMLSPDDVRSVVCEYSACTDEEDTAADRTLCYASGSASRALAMCDDADARIHETAARFLRCCIERDWEHAADMIDTIGRENDYETTTRMFWYMAHQIRSLLLTQLSVSQKFIFTDAGYDKAVPACFSHPACCERAARLCQDAIRAIHARANTALVFTSFMSSFEEILKHGERIAC